MRLNFPEVEEGTDGSGSEILPCEICLARKHQFLLSSEDPDGISPRPHRLVQCVGCGVSSVYPLPSPTELGRYYFKAYFKTPPPWLRGLVERMGGFLQHHRVLKFESIRQPMGRLLDVGCGEGNFLVAMRGQGWSPSGIEPSKEGYAQASKRIGLHISSRPLLEKSTEWPHDHFDLITFWHSFEHMIHPKGVLAEARRLLKKEGVMYLAVPNIASWEFRWFGKYWFHLDLPRHLYHYTPETLSRLIVDAGFQVQRVNHFTWEYNPFGFYQSALNVLSRERNFLYKKLKGIPSRKRRFAFLDWGVILLATPLLLPLAFLVAFYSARAGAGGCIEIFAKKRPE